jgi:AraC-like DNA-binding protein
LILSIISVNFIKNQDPKNLLSFANIKLISIVIYNLQILIYSIFIFVCLKKHGKNIRENFAYENYQINLTWLKIFFIAFLIFSILDLSVYYINPYLNLTPFYFILSNLFFIFLGYFGVRQNQIYNISYYRINKYTDQIISKNESGLEKENVYDKGKHLSEVKSIEIFNLVLELLENKKIYRKQDLSIFDIAEELEINKTYISNAINKISGTNFNTFINKFRIEESKKILLNPEYNNITIEAIANDVGFHSKSSFNIWFKKLTGQTPSEFKKQIQENS